MSEETIDRIDRYLRGELTEPELVAFENEMQINEELRKQVDFMRLLPQAIQLDSIRSQLKDIEAKQPKIEPQPLGDAGNERPNNFEPKSISFSSWGRYAIAASVLLLIGIFIFRDQLFKEGINQNQYAHSNNDSISKLSKEPLNVERQVAVNTLTVSKIEDAKMGFVKKELERKIVTVQEVDSTVLKEYNTNHGNKHLYGLYRFVGDTVFLNTGTLEKTIQIYAFDVKGQTGQMIDSSGQMIEYEKPSLKGLYLLLSKKYFKIEENKRDTPLSQVTNSEFELITFYTK
jgi:hypothetical protein